MPALNKVQLIGRLGKDPSVRFTPKGTPYTNFTVAVSRRWRNKEGELQEQTEWVNIEAWGRTGENCEKYLHKGSLVYLEGQLRTDRYEHEGETRYFTKVVVRNMQMLERREVEEEEVHEEEVEVEVEEEEPLE